MDPTKLPRNSIPAAPKPTANAAPEKHIPKQAVVQGAKVIKPKESFGHKLKTTFINDNLGDIKGYIVNQVIIPTVQGTLVSIALNSIRMLFKSPGGMPYGNYMLNQPYTSGWPPMSSNPYGVMARPNTAINYGGYARPYQAPAQNVMPAMAMATKPTDIQIPTEDLAGRALTQLQDIIQSYGRLTMLDFYETLGVPGNGYTDANYGWTDLMGVQIKPHYAGGYCIDMPKAVALMPIN